MINLSHPGQTILALVLLIILLGVFGSTLRDLYVASQYQKEDDE